MSKKIVISESQYRRILLNEQDPKYSVDDIKVYFNEDKDTIVEQTAKYYRLWANSTPELSKKYGKNSEFDLDPIRTPANSGTFKKSFSKGKGEFDNDWLIVPKSDKKLMLTKGGRKEYTVSTSTVVPKELTSKDIIYDRNGSILLYKQPKGYSTYNMPSNQRVAPDEIKEVKNIYSSTNTKRAIDIEKEIKFKDKEKYDKKIAIFRQNVEFLEDLGLDYTSPTIGKIIPYTGYEDFGDVNNIPSVNRLFAETAIRAIAEITRIQDNKGILQGGLGAGIVCVTSLGNSCKGSDPFITTKNFDLNLAKILSSQGIDIKKFQTDGGPLYKNLKVPASYIVMLHGFYFDYGKIYQNLKDTYKSDPIAVKSSLFPDGWWNFFTQTYGIGTSNSFTNVLNAIKSIEASEIVGGKIETLNNYGKSKSIWESFGDCFTDYHCILDLASIAALAIPGFGLAASAGLDFINAGFYGMEAASATSSEERDAALIAAGFTLVGGLAGGGISQTRKIIQSGAKNPKIYTYTDDLLKRVNKEFPNLKRYKDVDKMKLTDDIVKIQKELANKYKLTSSEVKNAHKIIDDMSKIDMNLVTKYSEALDALKRSLGPNSRVQEANLRMLMKNGSNETLKTLIEKNGDDIIRGVNAYIKDKANKEFLIEAGLFYTLTQGMEKPAVQQWMKEKIATVKDVVNPNIRSKVEKEGYDWKSTKEAFGAIGVDNPTYSKKQSISDNTKLEKAWNAGWRPYPKYKGKAKPNPTQEDWMYGREWLNKSGNEKYHTEIFKKRTESEYNELIKMFSKDIIPKEKDEKPEDKEWREKQLEIVNSKETIEREKEITKDVDMSGWTIEQVVEWYKNRNE